ncbi:Protein boule [Lamellibrachia satsuma]|nr:Protein boule [Lamellibrachia satsuma]
MTSSGEVSPASVTPAGTPSLISQAPKYGTLIPNRIFVGGIAANTTEVELKQYFMAYGAVKDCKIIADRAGVSKGYGFVTFETQEDAEKIIKKEVQ